MVHRIGLIFFLGLSLTACTVGIVSREELTPGVSATPTPSAMPTDTPQPSRTPSPVPTNTPEPSPTLAPSPTDTPLPSPTEEVSSGPVIHYFRADVEEVDPGDTIVFEWESKGATGVTLSYRPDGIWLQSEIDLDSNGTFTHEIASHQENQSAVFRLYAWDDAGNTVTSTLAISVRCLNTWSFALSLNSCPTPPILREAVEQHFEHGTMIWIKGNWGEQVFEENLILVLYDDNASSPKWATFPDEWADGDPYSDPTITPPSDLYQPVRGFGLVWRQNSDVRDRLGWALDQETGYSTVIQRTLVLEYRSTYLRAVDGNVWHLLTERSGWRKILVEN